MRKRINLISIFGDLNAKYLLEILDEDKKEYDLQIYHIPSHVSDFRICYTWNPEWKCDLCIEKNEVCPYFFKDSATYRNVNVFWPVPLDILNNLDSDDPYRRLHLRDLSNQQLETIGNYYLKSIRECDIQIIDMSSAHIPDESQLFLLDLLVHSLKERTDENNTILFCLGLDAGHSSRYPGFVEHLKTYDDRILVVTYSIEQTKLHEKGIRFPQILELYEKEECEMIKCILGRQAQKKEE